jgi:hypothetical protein
MVIDVMMKKGDMATKGYQSLSRQFSELRTVK